MAKKRSTKVGTRCKHRTRIANGYCFQHQLEFSKAVNGLREQGLEVTPIKINISELKKWCKQNNLKNTSSSRSKYVLEISNSQFPNSN